jgi:hypothetical protein
MDESFHCVSDRNRDDRDRFCVPYFHTPTSARGLQRCWVCCTADVGLSPSWPIRLASYVRRLEALALYAYSSVTFGIVLQACIASGFGDVNTRTILASELGQQRPRWSVIRFDRGRSPSRTIYLLSNRKWMEFPNICTILLCLYVCDLLPPPSSGRHRINPRCLFF